MDAARGDEIPYGEPMKIPEHMDSTDLWVDDGKPVTKDELRKACRDWLDDHAEVGDDFDAAEFFEGYVDPEGPFRYSGSFDAWDGILSIMDVDPRTIFDAIQEYVRDNRPMDPRKGPNQ
jgi:hypothetical protein